MKVAGEVNERAVGPAGLKVSKDLRKGAVLPSQLLSPNRKAQSWKWVRLHIVM